MDLYLAIPFSLSLSLFFSLCPSLFNTVRLACQVGQAQLLEDSYRPFASFHHAASLRSLSLSTPPACHALAARSLH